MERYARDLFARALRAELPDGWQLDEPGRCTAIVAQLYRIADIFLMVLMALPEAYHGAVERVELAMGRVELPAGWRPEGSDDPILIELFGSCWHAAPDVTRLRSRTATCVFTLSSQPMRYRG